MTVTVERPEALVDELVPGPSRRRRVLLLGAVLLLGFGLLVLPDQAFRDGVSDWRHLEALPGAVEPLDGPVGGRSHAAVVALGDGRVLVWGGRDQGPDSGAVVDPRTGSWEALPPAPGPGRFSAAAVWTGSEAVIWGGSTDSGQFDFDAGGVAYDPAAGTWRELPPAPFGLMSARAAAFDEGVLFTGGSTRRVGDGPFSLWLDAATQTWTLVDTPLSVVNTARLGDRLVATGPAALAMGRQPTSGWPVAVFDPGTRSWDTYADPLVAQWAALAVADDGTVTALTFDGLNGPLLALAWDGTSWEQVARSARAANGIVTIELTSYPPVVVRTDDHLLVGGEGALNGWDPDRRVLSQRPADVRTFGGTAVWTGREVVAPTSQVALTDGTEVAPPGWVYRP